MGLKMRHPPIGGGYKELKRFFSILPAQIHFMKSVPFYLFLFLSFLITSCRWSDYKKIRGNGVITTQDRTIKMAKHIKLSGSFDVEIAQGPVATLKVEADENLQPYIVIKEEDGFLLIKSKNNSILESDKGIKLYITTPMLETVKLSGSGNILGKSKFTGGSVLSLSISGSGDIKMEVNSPEIKAEISGSGSIRLSGETMTETIKISGAGDFFADELKAEKVSVKIAGSGDVRVFADVSLDIKIAGVGSVFYKGAATVKQSVNGSGEVKKME